MNSCRNCLNCDSELAPGDLFCGKCGQRTDVSRLTFTDITRDLMHAFANIERGPVAFAIALLMRPGQVGREYVEGKRRRYFGPFATLAVLVGLAALLINASGFQVLVHDGLPAGPTQLLERHFNVLLLLQLPLLGVACALLFRAARLTLPEHMVLAAYTLGVRAVVVALSVLFAFVGSTKAPTLAMVYAFWAAWYVYFGWAASQFYEKFYEGQRAIVWLRGILAAALGHALIMGLITLLTFAYQQFGGR